MLDNVLIPTDGTDLCVKAAAWGVALARRMGAKVTAVHVTAPAEAIMVGEVAVVRDRLGYEQKATAEATRHLDAVARLAAEAGVTCDKVHARDPQPWHGIIDAAKARGADLIVIASHGRRGLSAMLIGSETQKVVSHSHIPVVVYR